LFFFYQFVIYFRYVGNLDQKVTELLLRDIFQTIGPVLNAKIINDKNVIRILYFFLNF